MCMCAHLCFVMIIDDPGRCLSPGLRGIEVENRLAQMPVWRLRLAAGA